MKHRNILAVIVFSIITLGIYDLYWLVKTKKVLNQETNVHTPTVWLLFLPVLLVLLLIIPLIILDVHNSPNTTGQIGSGSRAGLGLALVFEFLAILAVVPITFYWFFKFSKAIHVYTNGEMSTAMAFILIWLLRFVGMAVIQDKFNDILEGGSTGHMATAPASSTQNVPPTQPPPANPAQQ